MADGGAGDDTDHEEDGAAAEQDEAAEDDADGRPGDHGQDGGASLVLLMSWMALVVKTIRGCAVSERSWRTETA